MVQSKIKTTDAQMALDLDIGQVWAAMPNRDGADQIAFEIVGRMNLDGEQYFIAAKHLGKMDLLSKIETSMIVIDCEGHSVPSNLTFSPQLEWQLTKRVRRKSRYS